MKYIKLFEFKQEDISEPISSFKLKDNLEPKLWNEDMELDEEVRDQLLLIATDFFEGLEIDVKIRDVVFCGSLCNYNWSEKYSDYDLHIIVDFDDIDSNTALVEKMFDASKKQWNMIHDIKIKGYEVEIAVQDSKDLKEGISSGRMGGVFSLIKNKWIKVPEKVNFELDEKTLESKSKSVMDVIEGIEEKVESNDYNYDQIKEKLSSTWDKIKKFRKQGLEEGGELSTGNLIFKLLRRNGFIEKIVDLKNKTYDKQFK